ncbi:phenylalanine--tRNA ligase subunit beta [Candidatus Gracilibacteria bacterium]|nr:phenylalanine--tRNA ligase subunit beta [Candidatus Gracilibacteria bacterium]
MKISLNLLKKFVDFNESDIAVLEKTFTDKSAEIDEVHFQNKGLEKVVIGKIEKIEKHPDADKMQVTQTNVGGEILQIVCGGVNISEGQYVPVALNGAVLPGDFEIKKANKRGVESNGMICAEGEMGIEGEFAVSHGIMDLKKYFPDIDFESKLGENFAEFYGLDDVVFEVENTAITNRPDLFSHFGWAREAVVIGVGKYKKDFSFDNFKLDNKEKYFKGKPKFSINFEIEKNLAKKISGFTASGIKNGQSPKWMQKILNAVGIKSISLLVDITNYVMITTGVPMHAFDLAKINGRNIQFRKSKKGEKLVILDGNEKELPENAIVMSDNDGIFDLCGIQGGENSGVSEKTSDVWFHFATYDPVLIRRASIAVDKRTDASTIFEKDVPVSEVEKAIKLTIDLVSELNPDAKISSDLFDYSEKQNILEKINLSKEKINYYFGEKISDEKVVEILEKLGFGIQDKGEFFEVKIPGFRFKDIEIEEDLIEEIMRVYGLDTIKIIAPETEMKIAKLQNQYLLSKKASDFLAKNGLHEAINFGFLGRNLLEKSGFDQENLIEIKNPLSEKLEVMRKSLISYLLENSEKNILNFKKFGLFEIGRVFEICNGKKLEKTNLAFILVGKNFFKGKEILQNLFEELGPQIDFKQAKSPLKYAHGGQNAEIIMQGKVMGNLFTLHPKIAKNFDLPKNTICFEGDFSKVFEAKIRIKKLKPIQQFPSSTRDETRVFDKKTEIGQVLKKLKGADKLLKNIDLIDEFESEEKLGKGKISLTFRFEYFDENKTLGDEEVNNAHQKVKERFLSF